MNASPLRLIAAIALAALITIGTVTPAQAAPSAPVLMKVKLPKLTELAPKVKFQAGGKLAKNKASIHLRARISVAGKSFTIPVFNMGIVKSKKSVKV